MPKTLLLLTAVTLLFSWGCRQHSYDAEIEAIDSLMIELNGISNTLHEIDTAKINSRLKLQIKQLNRVHQSADTIDKETALMLDKYAQCKKAYTKWGEKWHIFKGEAELRKKQLTDLREDLDHSRIEPEQAEMYYNDEAKNVTMLTNVVKQMDSGLRQIEDRYLESEKNVSDYLRAIEEQSAN